MLHQQNYIEKTRNKTDTDFSNVARNNGKILKKFGCKFTIYSLIFTVSVDKLHQRLNIASCSTSNIEKCCLWLIYHFMMCLGHKNYDIAFDVFLFLILTPERQGKGSGKNYLVITKSDRKSTSSSFVEKLRAYFGFKITKKNLSRTF